MIIIKHSKKVLEAFVGFPPVGTTFYGRINSMGASKRLYLALYFGLVDLEEPNQTYSKSDNTSMIIRDYQPVDIECTVK